MCSIFLCITIHTIYLYYWRKCNSLFVAQMKDFLGANEIPIGAKAMRRCDGF